MQKHKVSISVNAETQGTSVNTETQGTSVIAKMQGSSVIGKTRGSSIIAEGEHHHKHRNRKYLNYFKNTSYVSQRYLR